MNIILSSELIDAYKVLFGPERAFSINSLHDLQPTSLKAAYRRKARETHPDKARVLGEPEDLMGEDFKNVVSAYERLCAIINVRHTDQPPKEAVNPTQNKKVHPMPDNRNLIKQQYYPGDIPQRKLLMGQFLYYSRLISWDDFVKSINWHRRHRLPIGQMAKQNGMINSSDILKIKKEQNHTEKFGECALRMGYISLGDLQELLRLQDRHPHKPIGEYFVNQGIFNLSEINKIVAMQQMHNDDYP